MLHDHHLKIATGFSIAAADVAGGLLATDAIDLKTAARRLGDAGNLAFHLQCVETCVVSAGLPSFQFMAVLSSSNTLLTSSVIPAATMPFGSALSLSGALPKIGDRFSVQINGGYLGGKDAASGGSGVVPGTMLTQLSRQFCGMVYVNWPKTLVAGGSAAHAFSAGKFDIWLGGRADSGAVIYPGNFTVK